MPFEREPLIKDIEQRLSDLSLRIKGFTKMGLNDGAKFLEPFAARLLNAVYGWQLADPAPGVPNTKGIDLTDEGKKVAVQVSVQESAEKIKHTVAMLKDGKLSAYTTIVIFFLHHVRHRKSQGLQIINIPTLIGRLVDRELADLQGIVALLDEELVKPDVVLSSSSPRSNLPTIQRFFGRDTELAKLLPDLHPDATGWGALIDGPGGMGKTTLAIRAAELAAPGHYDDILFLSAKQTAMDPHGPHDESPFAVSGFTRDSGQKPMAEDAPGFECLARRDEGAYPQRSVTEEQRSQTLKDQADCAIGFRPGSPMLDAIARRLQKPEITQAPADERPRLLIDALTGTRTLLVLDNLETLTDADQRSLFAFLGHLPRTCKALLTSRPLVIATGRRLKLQQLDQAAALQTLADIARDNAALAAAPESNRLRLITETGGNTLLLTWTAWQVGSGYCTTIADALAHLRSCPQGNDPLEFIFGDLLARISPEEERIVATLSYPTEPILVTAIAEISGVDEPTTRRALKLLTNRSVVVPQESEEKYALVPMVAEFIRHARGEVVKQMGTNLADRAYALIEEKSHRNHESYQFLNDEWASVSPALRLFIEGLRCFVWKEG